MAEGSRGRMSPWVAFFMGALIVLVAVGAYVVWRGSAAVEAPEDIGIDLDAPAPPSLPPITPAPDPAPVPLPVPGPNSG